MKATRRALGRKAVALSLDVADSSSFEAFAKAAVVALETGELGRTWGLAAVETLTRYLAQELGSRRITANVIAPGAIATGFSGGMVRDNPEMNKRVASTTALGRVGQPDDVGGAGATLLAPESGWINGQRIEVSGGMGLHGRRRWPLPVHRGANSHSEETERRVSRLRASRLI